jgi:1,4-alpha-glucan branching enzyme
MLARRVEFKLEAPDAIWVAVVGSFNNFDARQSPLERGKDGVWKGAVPLPPGRHQYWFSVDGHLVSDPNAKDSDQSLYGSNISVVVVGSGRETLGALARAVAHMSR